ALAVIVFRKRKPTWRGLISKPASAVFHAARRDFSPPKRSVERLIQTAFLSIGLFASAVSFFGLVNYSRQRAHGDWDAWMIYNRAARFIFRDTEAWQNAFSPEMNLVFHADYPPLLALNIAARWQALDAETTYVPMFLGLLFTLAALGACFSALTYLNSAGQGAFALTLLAGSPFFMSEGGRQTADVPLAFFLLAAIIFLFLRQREGREIFTALAALMAGFAAWTKNEGLLFVLVSAGILFLTALWKRSFRDFLFYLAGLLPPLVLLFHFKTQVAPSSEFASGGLEVLLQKLTDPARNRLVFDAMSGFFLRSGGWLQVGIFPILVAYLVLFKTRPIAFSTAVFSSLAILSAQIIGYYLFYLISPYDLTWHIGYSLNRLFVHVYPATVFVVLAAAQNPEGVFSPQASPKF
ncbi:MAG: glycosyltransferase family 39 protein, partial [Chloroflexi bacterium]|nr:glycosyltransferase family 39 protein [Chloroflexota bacterium]